MSISVLRTSEDVDAPILTPNSQGSMTRLLKTVLVDGYGTGGDYKAPLGWELYEADSEIHSEITEMTIKNVAGSGTYLMIDGSGSRDTNATYKLLKTYMRAAESVESYSSGLGYSPPLNIWPGGYISLGYTSVHSGDMDWKVIGNGRSFWVITRKLSLQFSTNVYWAPAWFPSFFGDYDAVNPDNIYNFLLSQDGSASYTTSSIYYNMRTVSVHSCYGLRGSDFSPEGVYLTSWNGTINNGDTGFYADTYGPILGEDVPISFTKWSLTDGNEIVGTFPGVMCPQARSTITGTLLDKQIVSDDHTLHLLYQGSGASVGGYFAFIEGKGYDDAV